MLKELAKNHNIAFNTSETSKFYKLSKDSINKALAIYKPDYRFVKSAEFNGSFLKANIIVKSYEVTYPGIITYVTASQLLQLISQAGYVSLFELTKNSSIGMDSDTYLTIQRKGNVVFREFSKIKFKRKVLSNTISSLVLYANKIFNKNGSVYGRISFDFCKGAATGNFTVIVLNH